MPTPDDFSNNLTTSVANDPDKLETPKIDTSQSSESLRTVIVTKVSDVINASNVKQNFLAHITDQDQESIEDIRFKFKGTVLLVCKDQKGCQAFYKKYQGTKISDQEIFLSLFTVPGKQTPD